MINTKQLAEMLRAFTLERDWEQFHTPKNIATSIAVESAELLEIFQWTRGQNNWQETQASLIKARIEEELADILLYLIHFADKAQIDLQSAAENKLLINAKKYPIDKCKGSDKKYNE
jgi:dCTP diphosphatase